MSGIYLHLEIGGRGGGEEAAQCYISLSGSTAEAEDVVHQKSAPSLSGCDPAKARTRLAELKGMVCQSPHHHLMPVCCRGAFSLTCRWLQHLLPGFRTLYSLPYDIIPPLRHREPLTLL